MTTDVHDSNAQQHSGQANSVASSSSGVRSAGATTEPQSLGLIEQQLEHIAAQGQHRFDPVRFCFIEAMLRRSKNSRPAASQHAIQQLAKHLADYQQRFQQAQLQAQQHCQMIEQQCAAQALDNTATQPLAISARQQLEQHQFKAVARLYQQLKRRRHTSQSALQQLNQSLLQSHSPQTQPAASALDQQLQQHEAAASAALLTNSDDSNSPANGPANTQPGSGELKSIALFRASWAKRHLDNLANQAINNRPDNAGPLNPERLASGSLSRIKTLSPRYLNRFIGYVDTLLWLQQTEQQHEKATKKNKSN